MKVFLFLMFGLPCLSFARLGEDYASCVARYGEPIHTKENRVFRFHKNGYEIGVIMFEGKVGMIGFKKLGKDAKAVKMSDQEMEQLLSVNSGPWKRFPKGSKEPRWIAPNEDQAGYELPLLTLVIASKKYLTRKTEQVKEDEALKDF